MKNSIQALPGLVRLVVIFGLPIALFYGTTYIATPIIGEDIAFPTSVGLSFICFFILMNLLGDGNLEYEDELDINPVTGGTMIGGVDSHGYARGEDPFSDEDRYSDRDPFNG